jgi:hypothetical protein
MHRIRHAAWLCLVIGCGGDTTATEPSPTTNSGAESPARDEEPMAVIERLVAAVDAGDQEAMLATLHPSLREAARPQVAQTDRHQRLVVCLRETIANGTIAPLADPSRAAEYGEDPRQVVVPGHDDEAMLIRHEGRWYLLDTGC